MWSVFVSGKTVRERREGRRRRGGMENVLWRLLAGILCCSVDDMCGCGRWRRERRESEVKWNVKERHFHFTTAFELFIVVWIPSKWHLIQLTSWHCWWFLCAVKSRKLWIFFNASTPQEPMRESATQRKTLLWIHNMTTQIFIFCVQLRKCLVQD